jgi:hypothetical protein
MRKFNETERQVVRGLQSAKWSYSQITKVIDLIKWYVSIGEKVVSANIDPQELNLKFSNMHKYQIAVEVA